MKIIDLKTYALSAKIDSPFYYAEGWVKCRNSLIIEIITDEGIIGWGEAMCHGAQPPEITKTIIDSLLKPFLIGQDPFDVEVLWGKMYNATQPYGRRGLVINAISGLDIALWDCIGKYLGKPIYKLLGGAYRTEVEPYATGFFREEGKKYPDAAIEEALAFKERGFKAMKVKLGYGVEEDIKTIVAIRNAIGEDIKLMVDVNCAYNPGSARRFLKGAEGANIFWLEEPVTPDDISGYRQLRTLTGTYIAMGECEFSKIGFRDWFQAEAVDIIQPDLCYAGGFTECRKIATLAETYHVMIVPHLWGSGIGLAASLQFIATLPPCPMTHKPIEQMLEFDQSSHPFRQDLIFGAIPSRGGAKVEIPSKPGIGVEINREILEKFQI